MPIIKLLLDQTSIPEDAFPTDEAWRMPTYARMVVKDDILHMDVILRDRYDDDEVPPDFNSTDPKILPLKFSREELVRVCVRRSWTNAPSLELYIRDPGHVCNELYLVFKPWSYNNPRYHIDAFAKMLQDCIGVPVAYEEEPPEPEFPF
jgi:hypothetical protein